jgi:hypothetical protein
MPAMRRRGGVELVWGRLDSRAVLEAGGGPRWGSRERDGPEWQEPEYLEKESVRRCALDETVAVRKGETAGMH